MPRRMSYLRTAAILLLVLMLAACGGTYPQTDGPSQPGSMSQPGSLSEPDAVEGGQSVATEPPPAPPQVVLYEDDFSDPDSGWEHYREFDGILDYERDGYRMYIGTADNLFWVNLEDEYTDLVMEVDAQKIGGPDESRFGVMCRYDLNTYAAYYFLIASDGMYGIGLFSNFELQLLGEGELQFSELIHQGEQTNHIRAECVDNSLSLVVNGETLLEVQDDTLSSGAIGLLTGTFEQPGADILFDDLLVIEP